VSSFPLSRELFQTLLAIGWIDGELAPEEREAILAAAKQAGLPKPQVDALAAMAVEPVAFTDMDFRDMDLEQRLFVYAVASWVAQADEKVTGDERAALHAIATLLGLTGRGRTMMDKTVDELRTSPDAPDRLDLAGLRDRVVHTIREVVGQ